MEKQIKFTVEGKIALHKLHIDIQRSIKKDLKKLAKGEIQGKELKEQLSGFYSISVGKYRVIYVMEKDKVIVFDVGHRKDIYDKNNQTP